MFTALSTFSLATHDGPYEQWPLTTPLMKDGVDCASRVPGYVIEGQYQWQDYVLLINSWDCPFEESYDFVLLGAQHRIVAKTSLGVPYGSFLLHAHWPLHDVALRLHFYDNLFYTLTIKPPSGFFRRAHSLKLSRDLLAPTDEQSLRSIAALEASLEAVRVASNDANRHRQ